MGLLLMAYRGVTHHGRMHLGIALGAALTGAILAGALIAGDSVKATLRGIAEARLGKVTVALDGRSRFFADGLAKPVDGAAAVVRVRGAVAAPPGGDASKTPPRINRAWIVGVDAAFDALAPTPPAALAPQEVALNERSAELLGAHVGDTVSLRIEKPGAMPLDAPLASNDEDHTATALVKVAAIWDEARLGNFSLAAEQTSPCNVFADRAWLSELIEKQGQANLLLADGPAEAEAEAASARLDGAWTLEDIGLRLNAAVPGVAQLESDRIFLEAPVVEAALKAPGAAATLTYLVNSIAGPSGETPYSFVVAGSAPEGMPDDQIVLSEWLAEKTGAKPGDTVTIKYMEVTPTNEFIERAHTFVVHSIAPMSALEPERALAPKFPGLSDVENCRDWSIGMPMDKTRLSDKDNEAYWKVYGQTPKAIVTLAAGRALWGKRFGDTMTVRIPSAQENEAVLRDALRRDIRLESLGLAFQPVRATADKAVAQALDFGGLFLGMSFFLIVAALILLTLLYLFGLQQRGGEIGVFLALGWRPGRIRRLLLLEAVPGMFAGAALGAPLGAGYAHALLAALTLRWPGAVAGMRIVYHATPASYLIAGASVVVCAATVVYIAAWRAARRSPRALLAGELAAPALMTVGRLSSAAEPPTHGLHYWLRRLRTAALPSLLAAVLFFSALGLAAYTLYAKPDDFIEPFFSAATLALTGGLFALAALLRHFERRASIAGLRTWKLAVAGLTRRRGRSLAVAGLAACGCFLVASVSAMRANVALHADQRGSGTGGFAIYAETSLPLAHAPKATGVRAVPLRMRDGDEAGCLNLNHAQMPRVVGVPAAALAGMGAFYPKGAAETGWAALETGADFDKGIVPALVGDADTAMWGMQVSVGDLLPYRDESGRAVSLKIVGHLSMRLSVFQGRLLISETDFVRLFPSEAGFRAFLVDVTSGAASAALVSLNDTYAKQGMDAQLAVDRLRGFYAVESAYLGMFLALGGLGLILGAAGAAIVALRNLIERRREIAILTATGYTRAQLFGMYLLEHFVMIGAGTVLGGMAAAVAIVPLAVLSSTTASPAAQLTVVPAVALTAFAAIVAALWLGLPRKPLEALRDE